MANLGNWFDELAGEPEMIVPSVATEMEQSNERLGSQIHRGYVSPFVAIAQHAGIGQVGGTGNAAMFSAQDVIDLMRE
ncbi:MAG: hypothetical protein ABSF54_20770, partial [Bryobacteraceae bacterium]